MVHGARRIRRARGEEGLVGASHNRGRSKQDYATPMVLITAVKNRLGIGGFAVDLAADEANAKADMWIDEGRNSLALDWRLVIGAGWGWLNPPFDNITPWAKKCAETDAKIAFLVPASVGSNWYRDYVHRHAFTLFLNGYQAGGTSWSGGDFDFSGAVTLDDFTQFLGGYQKQGPPL